MVAPWSLVAFWDASLVGLAITCAVEVPAYLGAFAAVGWVKRDRGPLNRWSAIAVAIVVNVITVPLLWRFVLRGPDPGALLLAVLGVAAIEEALIFAVVRRRGKYPEGWGNRMLWCRNDRYRGERLVTAGRVACLAAFYRAADLGFRLSRNPTNMINPRAKNPPIR